MLFRNLEIDLQEQIAKQFQEDLIGTCMQEPNVFEWLLKDFPVLKEYYDSYSDLLSDCFEEGMISECDLFECARCGWWCDDMDLPNHCGDCSNDEREENPEEWEEWD